jgi:UDP-3-O-[3-hydroxymyristoyl] N-acetylglucosamine deacetylase
MIGRAGIRRLRRHRRYLKLRQPVEIADGDRRIAAYPAENFRVRYFIDFAHPVVGREEIEIDVDAETFSRALAPARTFGFLEDVSRLRSMDLIRGGSLDNAIVLTRDGLMSGELRFPDEFARHKALDLIGDLALVGRPLKAFVMAHKGGHALHTALVTRLLKDRSLWVETAAERPEATLRGEPVQSAASARQ